MRQRSITGSGNVTGMFCFNYSGKYVYIYLQAKSSICCGYDGERYGCYNNTFAINRVGNVEELRCFLNNKKPPSQVN